MDFWDQFQPDNNFFLTLIRSIRIDVSISGPEDADIIIYSCYGSSNKNYLNKFRIFYTGENLRPNFNECNYSLSFDFDEHEGKNIRLPLWLMQIDWFDKIGFQNPKFVLPFDKINDNEFISKPKTKFCSAMFNNYDKKMSPFRIEMTEELSKYKPVDCYGKPFGNWFYGEDRKYKIISDYKFNICFENSLYPGYFTEKLFHSKTAGCIPLYWADDNIARDFNTKSFLNLHDFGDVKKMSEYVIEMDKDDTLCENIRKEKLFNDNQYPKNKFNEIVEKINKILPF